MRLKLAADPKPIAGTGLFEDWGDDTEFWSTSVALPPSAADDVAILPFRVDFYLIDGDWTRAEDLINKLGSADTSNFAYGGRPSR